MGLLTILTAKLKFLIFKNPICRTATILKMISQTVAEIFWFLQVSRWRPPLLSSSVQSQKWGWSNNREICIVPQIFRDAGARQWVSENWEKAPEKRNVFSFKNRNIVAIDDSYWLWVQDSRGWASVQRQVSKLQVCISSQSCHTATGTHMPHGITQCYLPPGSCGCTLLPADVEK